MDTPHSVAIPAVIYCRVSSERQAKEGAGLQSQEQRCRSYALAHGYEIVQVFSDDGVSGALLARPGIAAMLAFLKKQKRKTIVLIDDISRIARDVKTHIELRAVIAAADGVLESPSMRFEDTAAGEFIEMVLAASAQFGRKGNREQVLHRQKARLQLGYWTFPAPLGYIYRKDPVHKKLLVPTPEARHVLGPALKAFGENRIGTKRSLALHLRENGFFGTANTEKVHVLEKRVTRIFDALNFYAGFISYPKWNIEPVKGQHEPIITPETLVRIEKREAAPAPLSPERRDEKPELPLRNFVRCAGCGRPYTGSLAKGIYPRYQCYAQGRCPLYGHSVSAQILEPAFEELLRRAAPSHEVWETICLLARAAWQRRLDDRTFDRKRLDQEWEQKNESIAAVVARLAKTTDDEIAHELENVVRTLKRERAEIDITRENLAQTPADFEAALERVSTWIEKPHLLWKNGNLNEKKRVHRLVFATAPAYARNEGFITYELTLPYLISEQFEASNGHMVDFAGANYHRLCDFLLVNHAPVA